MFSAKLDLSTDKKFTIQNVPIKCRITIDNAIVITDLQYKMFLLNSLKSVITFT